MAQDDGVVLGEIVVADGVRELAFSVPVEGRGLSMSYARTDGDTGYAEILSSRGSLGFQLIFM